MRPSHEKDRDPVTGQFRCSDCNNRFKYHKNLQVHRKTVHLGKRYRCPHCFMEYTRLSTLRAHYRQSYECLLNSSASGVRLNPMDYLHRPGVLAPRAHPHLIVKVTDTSADRSQKQRRSTREAHNSSVDSNTNTSTSVVGNDENTKTTSMRQMLYGDKYYEGLTLPIQLVETETDNTDQQQQPYGACPICPFMTTSVHKLSGHFAEHIAKLQRQTTIPL